MLEQGTSPKAGYSIVSFEATVGFEPTKSEVTLFLTADLFTIPHFLLMWGDFDWYLRRELHSHASRQRSLSPPCLLFHHEGIVVMQARFKLATAFVANPFPKAAIRKEQPVKSLIGLCVLTTPLHYFVSIHLRRCLVWGFGTTGGSCPLTVFRPHVFETCPYAFPTQWYLPRGLVRSLPT